MSEEVFHGHARFRPNPQGTYTLTLDQIMTFIAEGWFQPVEDSPALRSEMLRTLEDMGVEESPSRWSAFTDDELEVLAGRLIGWEDDSAEPMSDEIQAEIERRKGKA